MLIKILSIKCFSGNIYKLKEFLTQSKIKIVNKGLGLLIVIEQVAYIGLFLLKRALKWFKLYFTEIQENRLITSILKGEKNIKMV